MSLWLRAHTLPIGPGQGCFKGILSLAGGGGVLIGQAQLCAMAPDHSAGCSVSAHGLLLPS